MRNLKSNFNRILYCKKVVQLLWDKFKQLEYHRGQSTVL